MHIYTSIYIILGAICKRNYICTGQNVHVMNAGKKSHFYNMKTK